jgi:hypothetical protein
MNAKIADMGRSNDPLTVFMRLDLMHRHEGMAKSSQNLCSVGRRPRQCRFDSIDVLIQGTPLLTSLAFVSKASNSDRCQTRPSE